MLIGLAVVALLIVGLGAAGRFYLSRSAELVLRPGERVTVRELRDPLPGNSFLACPSGYCHATAAAPPAFPLPLAPPPHPRPQMPPRDPATDVAVPVFALPVERLAHSWRQMLAGEPEIFPVDSDPQARRVTLIQRTPLLRFPDIVTVELVALEDDRSSLAIYSRARYGRGDFGVNRRRVLRWLDRVKEIAGQ
jgi:hypothetical protein